MTYERQSELEKEYAQLCIKHRMPQWEREFHFADNVGRKWRFDFFFPRYKLGVELHGLIGGPGSPYARGGHATLSGMRGDMDKANAACMLGFRLLTFTQSHMAHDAIPVTMRVLVTLGWDPNKREQPDNATEDAQS